MIWVFLYGKYNLAKLLSYDKIHYTPAVTAIKHQVRKCEKILKMLDDNF